MVAELDREFLLEFGLEMRRLWAELRASHPDPAVRARGAADGASAPEGPWAPLESAAGLDSRYAAASVVFTVLGRSGYFSRSDEDPGER